MKFKTLDDFKFRGKLVLLRIDVNAAVARGEVLDSPRFTEAASTIKELMQKKALLVILAHQGRKGDEDFLSLDQHAVLLGKHVGKKIQHIEDVFGEKALGAIDALQEGESLLLGNVRNEKDEIDIKGKNKYEVFSEIFDIYVNDAFSVCHREQGSVVIPPKIIPSCVGRSMEKELNALGHFHLQGKGVYFLGGTKIEDYLPLIKVLEDKKNSIVASGVFGNLLWAAQSKDLGFETQWLKQKGYFHLIPEMKKILQKYREQIILPIDFVLENKGKKTIKEIPFSSKIMDVGERSLKKFSEQLKGAKVVFMKGPLGFSEYTEYSEGTVEILKKIATLTRERKIFSLIGGGHLTTTIAKYKIPDTFSHISSSGGALIHYIAGKKLPGLEVIEKR